MARRREIIRTIEAFGEQADGNAIRDCGGMRIYDSPLVGFASAQDSLYTELRRDDVIGPHHRMPYDWVENARTVIAYFLPFRKKRIT